MAAEVPGRRRPDMEWGEIPDDPQPGDIWRILKDGKPMSAKDHANGADPDSPVHQNLTDEVWGFYSPDGNGMGYLTLHTVRSHEDGTVSVRPNDGSSNSIKHEGGAAHKVWHGYIEHNVWREV